MFVDIHNHILPEIDDGAETLYTALRMAERAVKDGTDIMIATPHRAYGSRHDCTRKWVVEQVKAFQGELKIEHIPLTVLPGVEIPMAPQVADELLSGHLATLGDAGRWALIEPPFEGLPKNVMSDLSRIFGVGIGVVIAHPERNSEVQKGLGFMHACAKLGCIFQLTTTSIIGDFGRTAQRTSEHILEHHKEWQIVIASDSHDHDGRPTDHMRAARDYAARIVGEEAAQAMVDSRPRSLVVPPTVSA